MAPNWGWSGTVPPVRAVHTRALLYGRVDKCTNPALACWRLQRHTLETFTITEARAVDLTWNLVVGRGLQTLIGFVSYRVACYGLLRVAETVPVSYDLFQTVALRPLSFPVDHAFVAGNISYKGLEI